MDFKQTKEEGGSKYFVNDTGAVASKLGPLESVDGSQVRKYQTSTVDLANKGMWARAYVCKDTP